MLQLTLEDSGQPLATTYDPLINDEECPVGGGHDTWLFCAQVSFCGVCEVASPVRRVTVRGLCVLSIFDRVYNYMISEEGQPRYLGSRTSVLFYNKTLLSWVWYDRWGLGAGAPDRPPQEGPAECGGQHLPGGLAPPG